MAARYKERNSTKPENKTQKAEKEPQKVTMTLVTVLLVLIAATLVATIPAREADLSPNVFFQPVPIPTPFITECLKTINKVEDCEEEVLLALLQGKLKFSPNCCAAIGSLPDSCFGRLFLGPYTQVVGDQVKSFCERFVAPIGSP